MLVALRNRTDGRIGVHDVEMGVVREDEPEVVGDEASHVPDRQEIRPRISGVCFPVGRGQGQHDLGRAEVGDRRGLVRSEVAVQIAVVRVELQNRAGAIQHRRLGLHLEREGPRAGSDVRPVPGVDGSEEVATSAGELRRIHDVQKAGRERQRKIDIACHSAPCVNEIDIVKDDRVRLDQQRGRAHSERDLRHRGLDQTGRDQDPRHLVAVRVRVSQRPVDPHEGVVAHCGIDGGIEEDRRRAHRHIGQSEMDLIAIRIRDEARVDEDQVGGQGQVDPRIGGRFAAGVGEGHRGREDVRGSDPCTSDGDRGRRDVRGADQHRPRGDLRREEESVRVGVVQGHRVRENRPADEVRRRDRGEGEGPGLRTLHRCESETEGRTKETDSSEARRRIGDVRQPGRQGVIHPEGLGGVPRILHRDLVDDRFARMELRLDGGLGEADHRSAQSDIGERGPQGPGETLLIGVVQKREVSEVWDGGDRRLHLDAEGEPVVPVTE